MNLKTTFPNASQEFLKINSALPATVPERDAPQTLVNQGKGAGQIRGRIRVCYTGFFVRPQDTDNLAGATKVCTDTLRAVGLLPADDPYSIELSWKQERVATFDEERLEITIT